MTKLFACIFAVLVLTGCNTVEGFGKDMQQMGQKLEKGGKK